MRCRAGHLLLLLALWLFLGGCGRPRVIPERKMVRIYKDMFLVDTWIRDNPDIRKEADSSLVYDPVFHRYGYRYEDFEASFRHYLDKPDQFMKIVTQASEEIRVEGERLKAEAEAEQVRREELDVFRRTYTRRDLSTDSLRWAGTGILWRRMPVASVRPPAIPADSLAAADTTDIENFNY